MGPATEHWPASWPRGCGARESSSASSARSCRQSSRRGTPPEGSRTPCRSGDGLKRDFSWFKTISHRFLIVFSSISHRLVINLSSILIAKRVSWRSCITPSSISSSVQRRRTLRRHRASPGPSSMPVMSSISVPATFLERISSPCGPVVLVGGCY